MFVPGSGAGAKTLTERLQEGDNRATDTVLGKLVTWFDRVCYTDSGRQNGMRLFERYGDRFFSNTDAIAKAEERLSQYAQEHFGARRMLDGYEIGDEFFPSPSAIIFDPALDVLGQSCIIHGDFNSDNIILQGDKTFVIDFQKTGRGHILEDLLSLEASIRINWPADSTVEGFCSLRGASLLTQMALPTDRTRHTSPRSDKRLSSGLAKSKATSILASGSGRSAWV